MLNKRGQERSIVSTVILWALGIYALAIILLAVYAAVSGGAAAATATGDAFETVNDVILVVLKPLLGFILGVSDDTNELAFLKIIVFLMVAAVIITTVDSLNLFGKDTARNSITNFVIGLLVSIIGVRFMPDDIWFALVAPSNAFVAVLLVGLPFAALLVITSKLLEGRAGARMIRKAVWLGYVILFAYLVFFDLEDNIPTSITVIYLLSVILGLIMIFFGDKIRGWFKKEKIKDEIQLDRAGQDATILQQKINEREEKNKLAATARGPLRDSLNREIRELDEEIAELQKKFSQEAST